MSTPKSSKTILEEDKETKKEEYTYYAVMKQSGDVQEYKQEPLPLQPDEIEIKIHACGVCHSDLHQQHNDWGIAKYPLVVGHEIIGEIIAIGDQVEDELKIGDRVGVGPQTGCCGKCQECNRGHQQFCPKKDKSYNTATGNPKQPMTFGGFAKKIRVKAAWAFLIPDNLPTKDAAPLMCAGITTWTPFVRYGVKIGSKVGIVGLGGLGHVGLQFAVKMGCDTYAVSRSPSKAVEAKGYGAGFINVREASHLKAHNGSFDFLLSTISANGVNWNLYLDLLRPDGKLCMVGLPGDFSASPMKIVARRLTICGSYLANNQEIKNMLQFCAAHNITAMTEVLPMTAKNCNVALKKIEENDVRYRMVLENKEDEPAAKKPKL